VGRIDQNNRTDFLSKLKRKWGVESPVQFGLILLVFSITGMTVVFLRQAFFELMGFDEQTSFWLKTVAYLLFIFPAYQILILVYGFLLGQFDFFWSKERRLFLFLVRVFKGKER